MIGRPIVPTWLGEGDRLRAQVALSHSMGGFRAVTRWFSSGFTCEDYVQWRKLSQQDVEMMARLHDEQYLYLSFDHPNNPITVDGEAFDLTYVDLTNFGSWLLRALIDELYPRPGTTET
nr:hypothetical protein [Kibdelosporangium sp. MJ126-NF4]CTQ94196.1 hypothetical protein [Kibdelosporangium sp. MJ126-NF4]